MQVILETLNGLKQFILKGNVVDLAVGVVIGSAFNAVITAFVKDLLTPLISAIRGEPNFNNMSFVINHSHFMYGEFINALVTFLLEATVLYFFVVLPMNRLIIFARLQRKPQDPTTKKCPYCLSEIPIKAHRCAFCTSRLSDKEKA